MEFRADYDYDNLNFDLIDYVKELDVPNFRGVFMRDTLPKSPRKIECGIVNLNSRKEKGSHWVCYYKKGFNRIYFYSFGQITPIEVQNYLKNIPFSKSEISFSKNKIKWTIKVVKIIFIFLEDTPALSYNLFIETFVCGCIFC